jgi:hypothetical protein
MLRLSNTLGKTFSRQCSELRPDTSSFSPHRSPPRKVLLYYSIVQKRKVRSREVERLAQGHSVELVPGPPGSDSKGLCFFWLLYCLLKEQINTRSQVQVLYPAPIHRALLMPAHAVRHADREAEPARAGLTDLGSLGQRGARDTAVRVLPFRGIEGNPAA